MADYNGAWGMTDQQHIEHRFRSAVNMTPTEIEAWLRTRESHAVGFRRPGAMESVGRQSARKIIRRADA